MEKRESWLLCLVCFIVSRDCCVALPHGAMGLSEVCDFFNSFSLIFFVVFAGGFVFSTSC